MRRAVGRALSRAYQSRTAGVGPDALSQALALVDRAERESRLLRAVAPRSRRYHVHDTLVIAEGLTKPSELPFHLPAELATPRGDLPHVRADVVRVGRTDRIVRARAFYLDARVTLTAHGRLPLLWPGLPVLHRGAAVLERVNGLSDFVLPRPLERGRGTRHAWLVEELVHGHAISPDEWPAHAPRVLEGLAQMWIGAGVETKALGRLISAGRLRSALAVLEEMSDLDTDHAALTDRVRRLASIRGSVLIGWCHGDPTRTNVLRMPDDRLALTDWEMAGRKPLGWDGSKTISSLDDPLPAADSIAATMESIGGLDSLPWREQLAVGCLVRLARSETRLIRAEVSGSREFQKNVMVNRERSANLLAKLLSLDS